MYSEMLLHDAFLYDMCLKNPDNLNNWVCNIRKELCNSGLNDLWNSQAMLSYF
jgi:hypothetical protein